MFFDTKNESAESFQVIPEGQYRFIVVDASGLKPNKNGDGKHLEVTLEAIEGASKGEQVKARFNYEHSKPTVQRIGRAEIKRFLDACGVTEPLASEGDFRRLTSHRTVWGTVSHRRVNDKTFADVGGFLADTPGAPVPARAPKPTADNSSIPF